MRRAWDTMVRRDASGLEYLDPDVEIEVGPELSPDAGTYRGHDGYRALLRQWFEPWEDVRYEPAEFIDGGGDLVIVVTRMRVRSRTGVEMANTIFFVYTIRESRITRIKQVPSRSAAFRIASEKGG